MSFDIIGLAKNKRGRDFIIADLHGMNECLESVIKKLGLREGDRLFIAGDLVDRGRDSLGVIETILKSLKSDIEIHAIKGNHEKMTLDSIRALERIVAHRGGDFDLDEEELRALLPQLIADKSLPKDTRDLIKELQNHIHPDNGGIWIVDLFYKEFRQGKIKFNEGGKVNYEVDSKVKMIYGYMDDLPYIISVQGDEKVAPFNIVHADMPINDLEVKRRLNEELAREKENYAMLTPEERVYALWARKANFRPSIGRTPFSVLTYCGHTIIGKEAGDCLRRDTSTVDLDRGAYLTKIAIVVNHKLRKVLGVPSEKNPPLEDQVKGAEQTVLEIKNYLSEKLYLERLRRMMKDIVKKMSEATGDEVTTLFSEGLLAINVDIQSSGFITLKQWDPQDFLRYAHADIELDEDTIRKLNEKVAVSMIDSAKDDAKTLEREVSVRTEINILCELYNFYRQPTEPLQYDAMLDRLFPEKRKPAASQKGLFAVQDKTGAEQREALQREVREAKEKFIDEKKEEYLYQPGVLDLATVVKQAADFIAELNTKIKLHNEAYPQFAINYLSCCSFYKDNEDELYQDLNRSQGAFVKSSLEVEDVKSQLAGQVAKCTSAEEVNEIVRDTYAIIDDIVRTHNGKFEPIIKDISLAELEKFAEEAKPKKDSTIRASQ